jgi:hypothetical protein
VSDNRIQFVAEQRSLARRHFARTAGTYDGGPYAKPQRSQLACIAELLDMGVFEFSGVCLPSAPPGGCTA